MLTASRLNFRVIHCLCFRLCQRTQIAGCLAEQTLPLISSFMLDRSCDRLLTRRVTKQRDSFKTRLTGYWLLPVCRYTGRKRSGYNRYRNSLLLASRTEVLEVMEPLALKFGDTPSIPIGCNRLQSVAIGCNRLQPIRKFGVSMVLFHV